MYHINFKLAIQEKGYIPTICSIYLFVIFWKDQSIKFVIKCHWHFGTLR